MKKISILFLLIFTSVFSQSSFGQVLSQKSTYKSGTDESLTIKKVTFAKGYDNVSNIYAEPITTFLIETINEDRQWDTSLSKSSDRLPIEDYENSPELVMKICKSEESDALLAFKLTKGPAGINIRIELFSAKDGLPISAQDLKNYQGFDIPSIKLESLKLYSLLRQNLPYHGIILSRSGTSVTLNLGAKANLRIGENLLVIQVTKLNRHPMYKFVVSNEKEILGKIVLEKVDDTISFGSIVYEREPGVIQAGSKILINTPVFYPGMLNGKQSEKVLGKREDSKVSLGENPEEWVPTSPPTFGKVGLTFGIGTYQANASLNTAGAISASSSIAPGMDVDGELWITPNINLVFDMSQNIATLANPLTGSSPGSLSFAIARYRIGGSYNFLLTQDYFGPKIQLIGAYSTYKVFVDDTTPVAYTSTNYYGLCFGVKGSFPITDTEWSMGADFFFHYNPSVSESPTDSGNNNSNSVNQFGFFASRKWKENMNILGKLTFDHYGSEFSGTGTRGDTALSMSQTLSSAKVGIEYLF